MRVLTLVDLFRTLETRRGEFLVYDDGYRVRRHTYTDVTRAARGFAAQLATHGVVKGDKVILWGENRPEWIACRAEKSGNGFRLTGRKDFVIQGASADMIVVTARTSGGANVREDSWETRVCARV